MNHSHTDTALRPQGECAGCDEFTEARDKASKPKTWAEQNRAQVQQHRPPGWDADEWQRFVDSYR